MLQGPIAAARPPAQHHEVLLMIAMSAMGRCRIMVAGIMCLNFYANVNASTRVTRVCKLNSYR